MRLSRNRKVVGSEQHSLIPPFRGDFKGEDEELLWFDTQQEAEAWEANTRLAISRGEPINALGTSATRESFTQYYQRVHPVLWDDTLHGSKVINTLKEIERSGTLLV